MLPSVIAEPSEAKDQTLCTIVRRGYAFPSPRCSSLVPTSPQGQVAGEPFIGEVVEDAFLSTDECQSILYQSELEQHA